MGKSNKTIECSLVNLEVSDIGNQPNRVTDGVLLDPVSQSQRQLLAPKKTLTTGHTSWVLIYQELKQKSAY